MARPVGTRIYVPGGGEKGYCPQEYQKSVGTKYPCECRLCECPTSVSVTSDRTVCGKCRVGKHGERKI